MNKPWKKSEPSFIGNCLGKRILENPHSKLFIETPLLGGSFNAERASALMAGAYHLARHNVILDDAEVSKIFGISELLYLRSFWSAMSEVLDQYGLPMVPRSRVPNQFMNEGTLAVLGNKTEVSATSLFFCQSIHHEDFFNELVIEEGLGGSLSGISNALPFSRAYAAFVHSMLGLSLDPLPVEDRKRLTLALTHAIAAVNNLF